MYHWAKYWKAKKERHFCFRESVSEVALCYSIIRKSMSVRRSRRSKGLEKGLSFLFP